MTPAGATGPTGPTGPTGSRVAAYAYIYTTGAGSVANGAGATMASEGAISGITHSPTDALQLAATGVYEAFYTVTVSTSVATSTSWQLNLNGTGLLGSRHSITGPANMSLEVTGNIIFVTTGTGAILQLINASGGDVAFLTPGIGVQGVSASLLVDQLV